MKAILALVFCLFFCITAMAQAECPEGQWPTKSGKCVTCPKGKWFDPNAGKCITPGEDPTGETDREFRRQLVEEGQIPCNNGWCCKDQKTYDNCMKAGNEDAISRCLKRNKCFVYGE